MEMNCLHPLSPLIQPLSKPLMTSTAQKNKSRLIDSDKDQDKDQDQDGEKNERDGGTRQKGNLPYQRTISRYAI